MPAKKEIIRTIVIVWIIGSVAYIASDVWNDYKTKGLTAAYKSGIESVTKQIFDKSKEGDCTKTIELTLGEEKLSLIETKCLGQTAPQEEVKK